jgi:hypothetical protein
MAYRGKIQLTATERLLRPYFGMHCFEWPDDPGVEFHLGFGDWVRLLRANGFEVIDFIEVQAPVGGDPPVLTPSSIRNGRESGLQSRSGGSARAVGTSACYSTAVSRVNGHYKEGRRVPPLPPTSVCHIGGFYLPSSASSSLSQSGSTILGRSRISERTLKPISRKIFFAVLVQTNHPVRMAT